MPRQKENCENRDPGWTYKGNSVALVGDLDCRHGETGPMSHKASIDTIFCSAIEIESADERRFFVEEACGEHVDLKHQVERLLHAHFHGRSFLDAPVQPSSTRNSGVEKNTPPWAFYWTASVKMVGNWCRKQGRRCQGG